MPTDLRPRERERKRDYSGCIFAAALLLFYAFSILLNVLLGAPERVVG